MTLKERERFNTTQPQVAVWVEEMMKNGHSESSIIDSVWKIDKVFNLLPHLQFESAQVEVFIGKTEDKNAVDLRFEVGSGVHFQATFKIPDIEPIKLTINHPESKVKLEMELDWVEGSVSLARELNQHIQEGIEEIKKQMEKSSTSQANKHK